MPIESSSDNAEPDFGGSNNLRILCLHDAHSSASGLKDALSRLGDRLYLKHGIDLVYINSPLCVGTQDGDTNRIWYDQQDNNAGSNKAEEDQLLGLDASLCLLQQIWTSMPFWGILGVGQGAAIGSLLSLLPHVKPKAKFGMFIQGEALIQEAEQLVDTESGEWSCLHVIETDDNKKTSDNSKTEKLIQQFGGVVHRINHHDEEQYHHHDNHNHNNNVFSKKVMNVLGKFIIEQKKKTRQQGESHALALQNQLHIVEQEASRLIAKRIAENPPNMLMAVIAPKEVGAVGMKRRGPTEEGGGAPCPPEFLLRRDTRAHLDDHGTSSRVHPMEAERNNNNQEATSDNQQTKNDNQQT